MKFRKTKLLKKKLRVMTRKEINVYLEEEVFNNYFFKKHIKEVSLKTKINERTVEKVLRSYITQLTVVINTVLKVKTKINVYGFFSLNIEKGNYF